MEKPIRKYLSSEVKVNTIINQPPYDNCFVGCCCCHRPSCNVPSQVFLDGSILKNQPRSSDLEHNISYEYKEPEENFVSIDDVKIKQFLTKIGQEKEASVMHTQFKNNKGSKKTTIFSIRNEDAISLHPVVYEIIELDDEEERKKLKRMKQQAEKIICQKIPDDSHTMRQSNCLDISLIPKFSRDSILAENCLSSTRSANPKIVAEIDLVDSSSNDSSIHNNDSNCFLDKFHREDRKLLSLEASVPCELLRDDTTEPYKIPAGFRKNKYLGESEKSNMCLNPDDEIIDSEKRNLPIFWNECSDRKERVFFECFQCGKKVQSSYNLRRHMMIHTGERPFNCDLCSRKFREFSDLKKHRRRHAGERQFLCMVCRKYPPTDNDPTRCVNCCAQTKSAVIIAASAITPSHSSIVKQIRKTSEIASNIEEAVTTCINKTRNSQSNTSQTPLTAQYLLSNLPVFHRPNYDNLNNTTRKEYPCPLCSRVFGSRHNLKRHYMIHTGEKPFSCNECRKPFRECSTLKKHMITHQRDRWYKCTHCSYKFQDFLQYSEHKSSHPFNTQDSFKVNIFKENRSLLDSKYHDSSSDNWLECCECTQSFTNVESYNNHVMQHDLNVRLYECYICKQQFHNKYNLHIHIELHSKQEFN